ncbi:hypothetical protein [Haladaptatus salinisoli]|uniref:hypothetical protein n=1 Tax=Haladaptatus salinisoli TaxID=2884876 RepID=UPI001D0A12EE|nr:hypothetical protein [Haladaptatus salinisoli]
MRADASVPEQLTVRPASSIDRAIKFAAVFPGPYGIVRFVASIPEPRGHPGPAGVGPLFIVVGLALIVLGGVLVRTLVEYYYLRRSLDARPDPAR